MPECDDEERDLELPAEDNEEVVPILWLAGNPELRIEPGQPESGLFGIGEHGFGAKDVNAYAGEVDELGDVDVAGNGDEGIGVGIREWGVSGGGFGVLTGSRSCCGRPFRWRV